MNCLFLSPALSGWGRAETWMRDLAAGLQARGDSCAILADRRSRWPEACRAARIEFIPFPARSGLPLRNALRLARIFRDRRPDAVIARGFHGARLARGAGPGVAVLLKLPGLRDLTDRWIDRLTFRYGVDRVLVDSYAVRDHFRRFPWVPVGKICAVHAGIPLRGSHPDPARRAAARRALEIPDGAVAIGVAAQLRARYRVMDAIEVFARADLGSGSRLLIFGEGPMLAELKRRAAARGVADRVLFAGWREDAAELMWGLDVYLHTGAEEGLPRALLEAMSAGVCVVAGRAGGAAEILRDGEDGLLAPAGDLPALAARLREAVADPEARARMGRASAERARGEFSVETMTRRVRETLEQTIAHRRLLHRWARSTRTPDGWHWLARPDFDARSGVPEAGSGSSGPGVTRTPGGNARRRFRLAHRLALLDTETHPHLAAGWRRTGFGRRETVLVLGPLAGTMSAADWLAAHGADRALRRRFLSSVAVWLGRRHAAGIVPHGLDLSTLLVRETDGDWHFILGDASRCALRWKPGMRELAAQMDGLLRSLEPAVSRADLLRFAADYRRVRHLHRFLLRRLIGRLDRPERSAAG